MRRETSDNPGSGRNKAVIVRISCVLSKKWDRCSFVYVVRFSELVNQAVKAILAEDAEDIAAFGERAGEPLISFPR